MKIDKLNKQFLDAIYKENFSRNARFNNRIGFYADSSNVYLTLDSYVLYVVPSVLFFIDLEHTLVKAHCKLDIKRLAAYDKSEYVDAVNTGELYSSCAPNKKSGTRVKIASVDDPSKCFWIDTDFLKMFDEPAFKVSKCYKYQPVLVFENGCFAGFIMPIRVEETK